MVGSHQESVSGERLRREALKYSHQEDESGVICLDRFHFGREIQRGPDR